MGKAYHGKRFLCAVCYYRLMTEYRSKRSIGVPPSFLREIFKIVSDPRIISFAGGLPNPALFPTDAFKKATDAALEEMPGAALQYGSSDGILELRELIARSYARKDGIPVTPDQVLITNGSQQGLDLIGKVFVNPGDRVVVETPTYLAAIQALSFYEPSFVPVDLHEDGIDTDMFERILTEHAPKLLYTIPNFQNPSGITSSTEKRERIAALAEQAGTLIIEDDPYGEIRFAGQRQKPYGALTTSAIMLGSFSKIVAPGLRLGWMIVRDPVLYRALEIAKQAADLHTSTLIQHTIFRYYRDNDSDAHVRDIAAAYKSQKEMFAEAIRTEFGDSVHFTNPEGGMFIWATFPEHVDTAKLFPIAIEEGVAFVPGESFFIANPKRNTMRLNYTNANAEKIHEGMKRLKRALERYEA